MGTLPSCAALGWGWLQPGSVQRQQDSMAGILCPMQGVTRKTMMVGFTSAVALCWRRSGPPSSGGATAAI